MVRYEFSFKVPAGDTQSRSGVLLGGLGDRTGQMRLGGGERVKMAS